MSKVDWSLAPDDATHFGQGADCGYWVKIHGARQYFINICRWDNGKWKESPEPEVVSLLVERPRKPWSGPEDGLPSFDRSLYTCTESHGTLTEIPGVHMRDYGDIVVLREKDQIHIYQKKTPEQLRETAIRELMDIAQVDCRVTAARLVDAGFKLEVV